MDDNITINSAVPQLSTNTSLQSDYGAFTWQPDMNEMVSTANGLGSTSNAYNNTYIRIMGCNAVLDLIDDASGTATSKNNVKAEALALRAYYYFNLVNIYGEPYNIDPDALGVPLKLTADVETNGKARNTVKEVYDQIVNDLTTAIDLMKDETVTSGDFHINLPTMYILLSRVYLYMEQWQQCVDAATNAIECGGDLTDMKVFDDDQVLASYGVSEVTWIFGSAEYASYINNNVLFTPSSDLMNLFDQTNDARYKTFFKVGYGYDYSTYTSYSGYYVLKHDNTSYTSFGQCVRIAEAYLNRAEAYVHLEDASKAAVDVNAIRRNRITGYTDVLVVTLDDVLTERRKELCFEQPRWFDLRRCGEPSITHYWPDGSNQLSTKYVLNQQDPLYVIPLPSGALEHNSELEQNSSAGSAKREGTN
jgi:hypothetical protein